MPADFNGGIGSIGGFYPDREEILLRAFGVVFFNIGALQAKTHFAPVVFVGVAGKQLAAFHVMAAFGGPVKMRVLPVVGHGISGAAATPGAGNKVAFVPVTAEKNVQVVIAVRRFGVGQQAAAGLGQRLHPDGDAGGQGDVEVRQNLRAPVVQDAVNAEVEFGHVEFEDVLLEQAQEALLGGGHAGGSGLGHGGDCL